MGGLYCCYASVVGHKTKQRLGWGNTNEGGRPNNGCVGEHQRGREVATGFIADIIFITAHYCKLMINVIIGLWFSWMIL